MTIKTMMFYWEWLLWCGEGWSFYAADDRFDNWFSEVDE